MVSRHNAVAASLIRVLTGVGVGVSVCGCVCPWVCGCLREFLYVFVCVSAGWVCLCVNVCVCVRVRVCMCLVCVCVYVRACGLMYVCEYALECNYESVYTCHRARVCQSDYPDPVLLCVQIGKWLTTMWVSARQLHPPSLRLRYNEVNVHTNRITRHYMTQSSPDVIICG